MPSAKLTSKGQITIPGEVRRALGVNTGDRLAFVVREDGSVSVKAEKRSLLSLCGIIDPKGKHVTIEEMNEIVSRGWAGKLK